uniref:Uncharacterized protein n=1 Tax=Megaselia scalaris TaxID=36166 RepID=T1GA60_MEGSC
MLEQSPSSAGEQLQKTMKYSCVVHNIDIEIVHDFPKSATVKDLSERGEFEALRYDGSENFTVNRKEVDTSIVLQLHLSYLPTVEVENTLQVPLIFFVTELDIHKEYSQYPRLVLTSM